MNYGQFCENNKWDQMDICKLICDYAEKAYDYGFEQGSDAYKDGYKKGLETAWECARKINDMTMEDCEEVFGEYRYFGTVVENYTAAEAIEKLKEHEAKHIDKGCESCKWEEVDINKPPCVGCMRNYKDEWKAKR